jgi:hypothetical protein
MREASESVVAAVATAKRGTSIPCGEHPFPAFVVVARALWPRKTAAHLAAGARVTERAAKFWLSGQREPSPDAFKAVLDQIMARGR